MSVVLRALSQCYVYMYIFHPLLCINVNIKPTNGEPELCLLAISRYGSL